MSLWVALAVVLCLVSGLLLQEIWIRRSRNAQARLDAYLWDQAHRKVLTRIQDPERLASLDLVRARLNAQQKFLDQVCRSVAASLHSPRAVITLIEMDRASTISHHFEDEDEQPRLPHPLAESYCQYVVAGNQTLIIENSERDPLVAEHLCTQQGIKSYIGTPVYSREGQPMGSLCVFDFKTRKWSDRERTTIESYAALISL